MADTNSLALVIIVSVCVADQRTTLVDADGPQLDSFLGKEYIQYDTNRETLNVMKYMDVGRWTRLVFSLSVSRLRLQKENGWYTLVGRFPGLVTNHPFQLDNSFEWKDLETGRVVKVVFKYEPDNDVYRNVLIETQSWTKRETTRHVFCGATDKDVTRQATTYYNYSKGELVLATELRPLTAGSYTAFRERVTR